MTPNTSPVWLKAASFAARAHHGQLRKDKKTPFIAHPFRVAMVLRSVYGCDDDVAIATALLHDAIEDTRTDFDDLEKRFGIEVADCTAAMTKNMFLREDQREPDYDRRLADAPWQARIVKLADVFDNAKDIPRPGLRKKSLTRCRRALELVTDDDMKREPFQKAVEMIKLVIIELEHELED